MSFLSSVLVEALAVAVAEMARVLDLAALAALVVVAECTDGCLSRTQQPAMPMKLVLLAQQEPRAEVTAAMVATLRLVEPLLVAVALPGSVVGQTAVRRALDKSIREELVVRRAGGMAVIGIRPLAGQVEVIHPTKAAAVVVGAGRPLVREVTAVTAALSVLTPGKPLARLRHLTRMVPVPVAVVVLVLNAQIIKAPQELSASGGSLLFLRTSPIKGAEK